MESQSRRQEGIDAAREERHEDAISAFKEVLKSNPTDSHLMMLLGAEQVRAGHLMEGIRTLAEASEFDPKNPQIWTNLAVARVQKGQTILAFSDAEKALALDPENAIAKEISAMTEKAPPEVASLANREPFWTRLGMTLAVMGVIATVLISVFPPVTMGAGNEAVENSALKTDPRSQYIVLYWVFMGVANSLWLLLDVLNRRARLMWLLPSVICCVCGVPWGPLALYLLAGRKANVS